MRKANDYFTLVAVVLVTNVFLYYGVFRRTAEFKYQLGTSADEATTATELTETVRILCIIMTTPSNIQKRAIHVRNTWAYRCNKYIFMCSSSNQTFPTVDVNVPNGRNFLRKKTFRSFKYIYENHLSDADWFLKADDDTFVIVENLRYFLSNQNKDEPIFFGHHFKTIVKQGYFSGGGSYVVSKEALRRFGNRRVGTDVCKTLTQNGSGEDVHFGKCMEEIGVKVGQSTDILGRSRFHCFPPSTFLQGTFPLWYYSYDALGAKKGRKSMSDYAISFHYVSPGQMYEMEYFLYHLRPYGLTLKQQDLNQRNVRV